MNDGQYILPSELLALAAFVFAPAVVLGLAVQLLALARMQLLTSRGRVVAALGFTVAAGLGLTIALLLLSPPALGPFVGLQQVTLFGHGVFVLPSAFFGVGLAGLLSTLWLRRARHGSA